MSKSPQDKDGTPVPFRRLSRLAGFGGMAANVAGGIVASGVKDLASGKKPKLSDLIMTPKNAIKVTQQLSNMRGAAMKIGQMISMDSGDFLPKEFADILARLRSDAKNMPRTQLIKVLNTEWGAGWDAQFAYFKYYPIAAASIGQVQRAERHSGEVLAIKVQYPGVRESIDSDINNVATLLRITGLIPAALDVKPLIEEGRKQLHEEADYRREAKYLQTFASLLSQDKNFEVPEFFPELSTDRVLTMSYIDSVPIEDLAEAPQETRNRIATLLIELLLRELFDFKVMQTDPNFANYRYNLETDRIVLLDFGASHDIEDQLTASYRNIINTILFGSVEDVFEAAVTMGFISDTIAEQYRAHIFEIIEMAIAPLRTDAPFDFGNNPIALQMRDKAMDLAMNRELWHLPPLGTVFIQRKIGGIYMLATRLAAVVNIHTLLQTYVSAP